MLSDEPLYLAGTGIWLPPLESAHDAIADGRYSSQQQTETGMESAAVSTDLFPPDMAVNAAKEALGEAGLPSADIAMTLHACLNHQGVDMWPAGAYVHHAVVGNNAPVMEIRQMSNGGLAALSLAADFLRARADRPAALITTADRFAGPRIDRWNMEAGVLGGDGGTAVVVARHTGFAKILALSAWSDTSLVEVHRGHEPFQDLGVATGPIDLIRREHEYAEREPIHVVVRRIGTHVAHTVTQALDEAGLTVADVDRWVFPHVGQRNLQVQYLQPLRLTLDLDTRSNWPLARTVGHLGGGDQFAGLHYLRRTGAAAPGEVCALVGIGAGFTYNCAIIRIER